jgi:hypothetical protein
MWRSAGRAGYAPTTGSDNIDIGSPGVAADDGVIRIGTIAGTTSTQVATYVAGIYNVTTMRSGLPVLIDSTGQLGSVSSSERFKTGIEPLGSGAFVGEHVHKPVLDVRIQPATAGTKAAEPALLAAPEIVAHARAPTTTPMLIRCMFPAGRFTCAKCLGTPEICRAASGAHRDPASRRHPRPSGPAKHTSLRTQQLNSSCRYLACRTPA